MGTAVDANFCDVVRDITAVEAIAALICGVIVLALNMFEHLNEIRQDDPLCLIACALAYRARGIVSVLATPAVFILAIG